jgi:phosphoribosylglycinamide formyltransferase 1
VKKNPVKIVYLASGEGSTFEFLAKNLPQDTFESSGLIVSRPGVGALKRAERLRVPAFVGSSEAEILNHLHQLRPDLLVLVGYLKKIPDSVLSHMGDRIINVHPSLLPKHGGQGMYGRRVHQAVLDSGDANSGATVHRVSVEYDEGPILKQRSLLVQAGETVESLESRVKDLEKLLLLETIQELFSSNLMK